MLRTIPGSSKHFFEIFPNFIWENSLNLYIWINLNYYENETKQLFSFQKNHDNLNLLIIGNLIKINIKQNFVRRKIAKHECVSFTIAVVSNISYLL